MGLELIAVVGVLMLGAGVMILFANLRKDTGSVGMLDQIGTYGYVAEAASRAAESPGRRPLDRLAGWLGDIAVAQSQPLQRVRAADDASPGGHVRHDAAQAPRLPGHPRDLPRRP